MKEFSEERVKPRVPAWVKHRDLAAGEIAVPCPFCGSTNILYRWPWAWYCGECDADGPSADSGSEDTDARTRAKDLEIWNRRVGDEG